MFIRLGAPPPAGSGRELLESALWLTKALCVNVGPVKDSVDFFQPISRRKPITSLSIRLALPLNRMDGEDNFGRLLESASTLLAR